MFFFGMFLGVIFGAIGTLLLCALVGKMAEVEVERLLKEKKQ